MNPFNVEPYPPGGLCPELASLLDGWPYKPLAGHAAWPPGQLAALARARVTAALANPQTAAWWARPQGGAGQAAGFAALTPLAWDSQQIGLPAGRLDYLIAIGSYAEQAACKQALLDQILAECAASGLRHLSARVDAGDLTGVHVLEQNGFVCVDGLCLFARETGPAELRPAVDFDLRLASPADSQALADLAREAYVFDRFHADPVIPAWRADELHAVWLRNSCTGQAADAVVVAEDAQGVLGFVTCKLQADTAAHLGCLVGTIVLVATAARARRRGVGRAATWAALEWFRQQGAGIVDVGTQLRNIPAARLYEACGFRLAGSSLTLRKVVV